MRFPGDRNWTNLADKIDLSWRKPAEEVFDRFTESYPGSFVERKKVALVWHYRSALAIADMAAAAQRELEDVMAPYEVEVMPGKANLEVRPAMLNKGVIARWLSHGRLQADGLAAAAAEPTVPPDFVMCCGDDHTDEDMFRALRSSDTLQADRVFTVTVGAPSKQTLASWHLADPEEVVTTLGILTDSDLGA